MKRRAARHVPACARAEAACGALIGARMPGCVSARCGHELPRSHSRTWASLLRTARVRHGAQGRRRPGRGRHATRVAFGRGCGRNIRGALRQVCPRGGRRHEVAIAVRSQLCQLPVRQWQQQRRQRQQRRDGR